MKSRVIVRLKEGVLDPQGQTIHRTLRQLGHSQVAGVRQGKYFELEFGGDMAEDEVRALTDQIARRVLSNPIIESYEIEEVS